MVPSIKARKPEKEHSAKCADLPIVLRCDECRKLYEKEKKRRQRKEHREKKTKTRSVTKKK